MAYTADQIKEFITSQNLTPEQIYTAAQQYGVSGDEIDAAMGWGQNTSDNYVQEQGWNALPEVAPQSYKEPERTETLPETTYSEPTEQETTSIELATPVDDRQKYADILNTAPQLGELGQLVLSQFLEGGTNKQIDPYEIQGIMNYGKGKGYTDEQIDAWLNLNNVDRSNYNPVDTKEEILQTAGDIYAGKYGEGNDPGWVASQLARMGVDYDLAQEALGGWKDPNAQLVSGFNSNIAFHPYALGEDYLGRAYKGYEHTPTSGLGSKYDSGYSSGAFGVTSANTQNPLGDPTKVADLGDGKFQSSTGANLVKNVQGLTPQEQFDAILKENERILNQTTSTVKPTIPPMAPSVPLAPGPTIPATTPTPTPVTPAPVVPPAPTTPQPQIQQPNQYEELIRKFAQSLLDKYNTQAPATNQPSVSQVDTTLNPISSPLSAYAPKGYTPAQISQPRGVNNVNTSTAKWLADRAAMGTMVRPTTENYRTGMAEDIMQRGYSPAVQTAQNWFNQQYGDKPVGYARGGRAQGKARGTLARYVKGGNGGQDDDVPAVLSHGEYVMDSETVSALGDGNNEAGAKKLDQMRMNVRKHKRRGPLTSIPPKAKQPEKYLKGSK